MNGIIKYPVGEQGDPHELLLDLIKYSIFEPQLIIQNRYSACVTCNIESKLVGTEEVMLVAEIVGNQFVFYSTTQIENIDKKCTKCEIDTTHTTYFRNSYQIKPSYVILSLKRYENIQYSMDFCGPTGIDVFNDGSTYKVYKFICHYILNRDTSHYMTFSRTSWDDNGKNWIRINDDIIGERIEFPKDEFKRACLVIYVLEEKYPLCSNTKRDYDFNEDDYGKKRSDQHLNESSDPEEEQGPNNECDESEDGSTNGKHQITFREALDVLSSGDLNMRRDYLINGCYKGKISSIDFSEYKVNSSRMKITIDIDSTLYTTQKPAFRSAFYLHLFPIRTSALKNSRSVFTFLEEKKNLCLLATFLVLN
jgi:hypothetical protein